MKNIKLRWLFSILTAIVLAIPAVGMHNSYAQGDSRTFPETGKTVKATFLKYWNEHGGLAQQGFPITEEVQEVSDTDGKTYTIQYFERAVFELHPEFAGTPNEVLLSLLGVFLYNQKYPGGAPSQSPNNEANSRLFPETGKRVGGKFLDYWTNNGGLAQQGFPISDEFIEVSATNGQPYKVQYFERAVFEYHPENAGKPSEVLLSLLGTFRLQARLATPTATPAPATATPIPAVPTNTPVPATATPAPPPPSATPSGPCVGVPPLDPDTLALPSNCVAAGTRLSFTARGFQGGETVGVYITAPDQSVFGPNFQLDTDGDGYIIGGVTFSTQTTFPKGLWAVTFEGVQSHIKKIIYFKLY